MISNKNGVPERPQQPPADVAVYLDFENLYVSLKTTVKMDPNFDLLMEKCREFGRVTVARAYADWSEFTRVLTTQMFANGFEPVYVPTRKFYDAKTRTEARKNSVDIHITIDIIKSLFLHENVDVFMLISGDRDYVPLINQIRQHGKAVYAIGVAGCTSGELSAAVDEMFFYHQLLEENGDEKAEQIDVYNQLMRAVRIARRRGYATTLGILKPIMKELVEGFNERNYKNSRGQQFQKFKDLVLEAQQRRLVRLVTTGSVSEVYLWGEDQPKAVAQTPRREEAPPPVTPRGGRRDRRDHPPSERRGEAAAAPAGAGQVAERGPAAEDAAPVLEAAAAILDEEAALAPPDAPGALEAEPATAFAAGPAPREDVAPPTLAEEATGLALGERTWEILREAMESFSSPPSPRKLQGTLRSLADAGRFGRPEPKDSELQELVRQAVEARKLERVRKGFSTILRMAGNESV